MRRKMPMVPVSLATAQHTHTHTHPYFSRAGEGGYRKSVGAIGSGDVDVGPVLEQYAHAVHIAVVGGEEQGGEAVVVGRVGVSLCACVCVSE